MSVSSIAFRLRMWIQIVIVFLGFWAPWIDFHSTGRFDFGRHISMLEWLALQISHSGVASFSLAAAIVIVFGALAAALGALFRVWGAAYLGYGVVNHAEMQAGAVMASGPYRHVRNPLYLGGWFMNLAVSLLMPPSGALFSMVLLSAGCLRAIFSEESFLAAKLGDPYRAYLRAVPRLMPRLRPSLPAAIAKPHWLTALLTEITSIGIFVTLAFLSWTYNNEWMLWGIFVSFIASMVARGLMETPIPTCAFLVVAPAVWGLFHFSILRSMLIAFGAALVVGACMPRKKPEGAAAAPQ